MFGCAKLDRAGTVPPELHRLSWASLDLIASGRLDHATAATLRRSQLSKRLLLLRLVADSAGGGRSGPIDAHVVRLCVDLLSLAERHSREAVLRVLSYPYVGQWLACCLRRSSTHPSVRDIAHLANVAASAAVSAGLDFTLPVSGGDTGVHLPALGTVVGAAAESGAGPIVIGTHDGRTTVGRRLRLPADLTRSRLGWRPLGRVHLGDHVIALDDIDPYRAPGGMTASERLAPHRIQRWRRLLGRAWLALSDLPEVPAQIVSTVRVLHR